jgi:O-antigen ligase
MPAVGRFSKLLDKVMAVGLIVAVIFTALAHGAVEPWSVAIFELLIVALMLVWAVKVAVDRCLAVHLPAIALPVAGLLILGLIQSVAYVDGAGHLRSLSMDVEATRQTVTLLFFLLVACLMGASFLTGKERLRAVAKFLVYYGLALAVFALVQHYTWNGRFYWFRITRWAETPFGPFVNHNHFAGYMELLIPLPLALALSRQMRREERLFYGFAAVLMGVATIVSLSRGGMISVVAEVMFLAVMSLRRPEYGMRKREEMTGRNLWRAGAVASFIFAFLLGVIWLGGEAVINRIATGQASSQAAKAETFAESRGLIWSDTWSVIKANPILGVGLGAFATAFPIYSRYDDGKHGITAQAHNDYLQVLADGGLVGGALAVWFMIMIFRATARGISSPSPLLSTLALANGAAIFGLLVHSLFDFNLQLPSTSLLFLLFSAITARISATVTEPVTELAEQVPAMADFARGITS